MTSWFERISHIIDGEAVSAGVTGRPDRQLEQNLRYLREVLDSVSAGEALVVRDIACESNVQVGHAVYWDGPAQLAKRALAQLVFDPDSGRMVGSPTSTVMGVVQSKSDSVTANIVIAGWAPVDLTNSVGVSVTAGRYFLSDVEAGKLKFSKASTLVPVLFADGAGQVLVLPNLTTWELNHNHHRYELQCVPAGDALPPAIGHRHTITNADTAVEGWLPADHAVFSGLAPANAKFGYNISKHPQLPYVWPPFPLEAAVLVFDRGEGRIGGTEVPPDLAVIDKHGIWWMSDCYDDVPWPATADFLDGSESVPVVVPGSCPRTEKMRLAVCFSRVLYDAAGTMVTSLTAKTGSVVTVTDAAGNPAKSGDLVVDADLALTLGATGVAGYNVLKAIADGKFTSGPVVEGLIASGANVVLSSDKSVVVPNVGTMYQGRVTIGLVVDPTDREIAPATIRMTSTKERFESGLPYLGFPPGQPSSVTCVYYIPLAGLPASPKISFRITIIGAAAGTLPVLTVGYRRIPAGTETPQALPTTDTALVMPAPGAIVAGQSYVTVTMPNIDIAAGDTLLLTISRTSSDGYSPEIGIVRPTAVLVQG